MITATQFLPCDALRLSLRLSLTLVDCDNIGWNSSKIISRLVSVGHSLSADPNIRGLLQGEHPEILAQSDPPPCRYERWRHSITNCGLIVTDSATVTVRAYRKPPSLFQMLPSLTPYDIPFLQNGGSICPKIRELPYLRNG